MALQRFGMAHMCMCLQPERALTCGPAPGVEGRRQQVWWRANLAHRLLRCCRDAHSAREPPNAADRAALSRPALPCRQSCADAGVCSTAQGHAPNVSALGLGAALPDAEAAPVQQDAGDVAAHMLLAGSTPSVWTIRFVHALVKARRCFC